MIEIFWKDTNQKNDFIYVPSNKIHAIKKYINIWVTIVIWYHISNIWLWWLENSKKRDFHIEDALNIITTPDNNDAAVDDKPVYNKLISNMFLSLLQIKINGFKKIFIPDSPWLQFTIIGGYGTVNNFDIKKWYDSFIVAHKTEMHFIGFMHVLINYAK